ncbi:MAG: hypothetical protein ACE5K8_05235, partial [Candidatus Zixiibacteriota bacterium]
QRPQERKGVSMLTAAIEFFSCSSVGRHGSAGGVYLYPDNHLPGQFLPVKREDSSGQLILMKEVMLLGG